MPPTFSRAAWVNGDKLNATNLNAERAAILAYVGGSQIDMLSYGLPTDGSTLCDTAIAAAKTANPGGGTLVFPPGTFKFTRSDLTGAIWNVRGQGRYTTTLWTPTDADDAALVMHADAGLLDISMVGPAVVNVSNVGSAPAKRGVILRDRGFMLNCHVEAYGKGVVIDGNHQYLARVKGTNSKHNIAWAQGLAGYTTTNAASFTHGNQTLIDCDFTGAGDASCHVAGDSKIDASDLISTHFGFAPHGILFAAANGQQMALGGGTNMIGVSFESCGINYIEDAGWNTANRRMSKGVKWIAPRTGPQVQAYDPSGAGGTEMVKLGICRDWTIEGVVGDDSNTSFGSVGWGTTSTACGFRFEQCNGLFFKNADNLWGQAQTQGKPMFRWEGGLIDWGDVYFTVLNGGYVCAALKNGSGGTLTGEKLVSGVTPASPTSTTGVKHYDGTGAAIGRLIPGGPLTNGLIVPVAFEGRFNGPPTTDATIAIGSSLTPDSANGGVKKRTTADQQEIGIAYAAPSGGSVQASIRGPWVARF
jgi:hypothetical protein